MGLPLSRARRSDPRWYPHGASCDHFVSERNHVNMCDASAQCSPQICLISEMILLLTQLSFSFDCSFTFGYNREHLDLSNKIAFFNKRHDYLYL